MKVLRLRAHHVMRLEDIDLDLSGHNLYLVGGKNAQGKTSTLTSLLMALCPKKKMDWPESPLKDGESEGWIKVDLSGNADMGDPQGFTAEVHFRRKRTGVVADEFRLLDSTGEEAPNPRALLEELFKFRAFDPLEFDRMKPADQRVALAEVIGLDLDAYQQARKELYDERTEINRDVKRLKARFEEMPSYDNVPHDPVDVADLLERKEKWQERENERADAERSRQQALQDAAAANQRAKDIEQDIERLQKKLAEEVSAAESASKKVANTDQWLKDNPTTEDSPSLDASIRDAGKTNDMVAANRQRKAAASELQAAERESKAKTAAMEKLDSDQQAKLEAARWPVPGLGIDEDGVTLNGRGWKSGSRSQRIEASVRIGMAMNPKLRLFVCQDGSDLDQDTLASLERVLSASDYQLVCEIVTRTAEDELECAVVIEDGKEK